MQLIYLRPLRRYLCGFALACLTLAAPHAISAVAPPGSVAEAGPSRDAYLQRLIEALMHDDAFKVRLQAAVLLGRSPDGRAVEALLAALSGDSEPTVRAAAALSLGGLQDTRAIAQLMQRLALDPESYVRDEAAQALRKFPREQALPYVMAAYGSEDLSVRRQVLLYLTHEPNPMMEPVLVAALGDSADVFTPAATALAHMPAPEALHILEAACEHRDPSVRRGAIKVLQGLGTPEAARLVLQVYDRDIEVDEVRAASREGLRVLRRFMPLQQIADDAKSPDKHLRARALKLLGVVGGDMAQQVLLEAAQGGDVYIRGTAVMALGDLGDPAVIAALEKLGDDPANARILHLIRHTLLLLRGTTGPK